MFHTCATHVLHMCHTCASHVLHMCHTRATHVPDMCQTYARHVPDMCQCRLKKIGLETCSYPVVKRIQKAWFRICFLVGVRLPRFWRSSKANHNEIAALACKSSHRLVEAPAHTQVAISKREPLVETAQSPKAHAQTHVPIEQNRHDFKLIAENSRINITKSST